MNLNALDHGRLWFIDRRLSLRWYAPHARSALLV